MVGLLAFFKRSLREHSRSGALVAARAALALTLIVCLALFNIWSTAIGAAGLEFFSAIILINALFITAGGCTYFASAIAEEKEDGTLDLLRITEVSSLSLLLGKGGARLLDGLLLLAVQIPFTLLGVTLGGISWTQVFAAYADLGGYLVLVCSVGLLAGILAPRSSQATLFSALALATLLFGGRLVNLVSGPVRIPSLLATNIFARIGIVSSTDFEGPIFSDFFVRHLFCAALVFGLAWFLLHRSDFEHSSPGEALRHPAHLPVRNSVDARPFARSPIAWKDYHFLHGGDRGAEKKAGLYAALTVLTGFAGACWPKKAMWGLPFLIAWGLGVFLLGVLGVLIEWLVATSPLVSREKQARTLAALMLLPLPHTDAGTLLRAKTAVVPRLLKPASLFLAFGLILLFFGCVAEGDAGGTLFVSALLILFVIAFILVPQALFLRQLVLHFSLRLRTGSLPLALSLWLGGNGVLLLAATLVSAHDEGLRLYVFMLTLIVPPAASMNALARKNRAMIETAAEEE